jgi:hypothetical protein
LPATARAHSDFTGKVSFGARRESGYLFMPYMEPFNLFVFADGVSQAIQGVTRNSVDSFYARFY